MGAGEEKKKKSEILGGPAEGGPPEGRGSGVRVVWRRVVQGVRTNNHNNHNHNNTNTARSGVEAKPRISVAPKGVGRGAKGARRVGPKGSGPLSPGLVVLVWRVWGPGQNVGLWVFGLSVFWVENVAKTLNTKIGRSRFGQSRS